MTGFLTTQKGSSHKFASPFWHSMVSKESPCVMIVLFATLSSWSIITSLAAGREFIVVFTHFIRGVRKHQVSALSSSRAHVPTVWVLIMLKQWGQTWCIMLFFFFIVTSYIVTEVLTEKAGENKWSNQAENICLHLDHMWGNKLPLLLIIIRPFRLDTEWPPSPPSQF